jgi:hypothetical protein
MNVHTAKMNEEEKVGIDSDEEGRNFLEMLCFFYSTEMLCFLFF